MPRSIIITPIYLEIGPKRTFAGALDWPGWCRSGKDEAAAQQLLLDYGTRYARSIQVSGLDFQPATDPGQFKVVEKLKGNATTDFGSPGAAPAADTREVKHSEIERLHKILQACWQTFDTAVEQARGKVLRKGPRGGGRELEVIVRHVMEAEGAYLRSIGWKLSQATADDSESGMLFIRREVLAGFTAAARGELPKRGPRGGLRWPPRYFVRRAAWHVLDHAWELEDRSR